MQLFNKKAIKKTLYHTWYIYPITMCLSTLLLMWGFQAYHQPSAHQKLTLFFATDIKDESFVGKILEKYNREKLREISPYYSLPSSSGYYTKLKLYMTEGDVLVLDEKTLDEFKGYHSSLFTEFDNETKEKYVPAGSTYYTYEEKDYAVLLKKKGENHYLQSYMDFDEEKDYYITFSPASVNTGKMYNEDNAYYDNALTFMNYLLLGNL